MAEVTTLARPYAEAVFKLADQANSLGVWSANLARLSAAAAQSNVREAIGDPKTTTSQLVDMFVGVFIVCLLEMKNFLTIVGYI